MQDRYASFEFVLPQGVIHGDANIGNELHDREGNPVVIDLDGFAIGPKNGTLPRRRSTMTASDGTPAMNMRPSCACMVSISCHGRLPDNVRCP